MQLKEAIFRKTARGFLYQGPDTSGTVHDLHIYFTKFQYEKITDLVARRLNFQQICWAAKATLGTKIGGAPPGKWHKLPG